MTTAEKLLKIDEGVEKAIALNAELEQTLYGADVDKTLDENVEQTESDFQAIKDKIVEHGVEVVDGTKTAEYASKIVDVFGAGKASVYQTVTITQDCTNGLEIYTVLSASVDESNRMVLFVNKNWNTPPNDISVNNYFLGMLWFSREFYSEGQTSKQSLWWRWRNGEYDLRVITNSSYDCVLSAGDEFTKVVIL